jgi:hypothetical protein
MEVSKISRRLVTPYSILFVTTLLSFIAWLFPDFGILRKGFNPSFNILSAGFFVAVVWYGLAIILAFFFFHFGQIKKLASAPFDKYAPFERKRPYVILTSFALIGVFASYYTVLSNLGFDNIIAVVAQGQANQLKEALYDDYSAGVLSLRYLAIQGCTVAIFRRFKLKLKSKLDFLNIALLLSVTLISSRLSLVMTIFACLILFFVHLKKIKVNLIKVASTIIVFFFILSLFSYSRNKNFYEAKGHDFWTAGVSEIITYLGAPFQGAIAVGNNPDQIIKAPDNWVKYAYIESNLSTNSAFLQLFQTDGWFSFIIMIFTIIIFSVLAGFLFNQKNNYLFLSVLTILYAFAEFWRLYWFGRGIMILLVIFPIIITFIAIMLSKSAWRNTK